MHTIKPQDLINTPTSDEKKRINNLNVNHINKTNYRTQKDRYNLHKERQTLEKRADDYEDIAIKRYNTYEKSHLNIDIGAKTLVEK